MACSYYGFRSFNTFSIVKSEKWKFESCIKIFLESKALNNSASLRAEAKQSSLCISKALNFWFATKIFEYPSLTTNQKSQFSRNDGTLELQLASAFHVPSPWRVLCFTSKSVVILLSCKCGEKGWGLSHKGTSNSTYATPHLRRCA